MKISVLSPPLAVDQNWTLARLSRVQQAAPDIKVFEFEPIDRQQFDSFEAGAHVDIRMPSGLIRQYSLLPPHEGRLRFAVKRETAGRGGSSFLHDDLKVGDSLSLGKARNTFPLHTDGSHSIFIAGGIGVTPFVGMIADVSNRGCTWELFYRTRSRKHAILLAELSRYGGGSVRSSFSDETPENGRAISEIVSTASPEAHLYCCGPHSMIAAFKEAAKDRAEDKLHVEHFGAIDEAADYGGYTVEFRRSKRIVLVAPGETILDAAIRAGVDASYSCSEGVCGACETRVLEGVPDHKDSVLSAQERATNRLIMICCSGCVGERLVLEL